MAGAGIVHRSNWEKCFDNNRIGAERRGTKTQIPRSPFTKRQAATDSSAQCDFDQGIEVKIDKLKEVPQHLLIAKKMKMVIRVADLRSDTITKPSDVMQAAMANADVDDDALGTNPTAFQLESEVAKIMGKQADVFVPSGTIGSLRLLTSIEKKLLLAVASDP